MVDVSAIAGIASSLKVAGDIAKAMVDLRDATMIQGKVIELQRSILEAQNSAFASQDERSALVRRVGDLEDEVDRLEAWETEKQRYPLKPIRQGDYAPLAYTLKEGMDSGESAHWVCPTCYQRGEKSILQPTAHQVGRGLSYDCHVCGIELFAIGVRHADSNPPRRPPARR